MSLYQKNHERLPVSLLLSNNTEREIKKLREGLQVC